MSNGIFRNLPLFSGLLLISTLGPSLFGTFGDAQFSPVNIEFLFADEDKPGDGISFQDAQSSAPPYLKRTTKICTQGLWVLFSSKNFGLGENPENVSVTAVSGSDRRSCFPSYEDTLKTMLSFRPVASLKTQIETFAEKNFLSALNTGLPASAGELKKIKSFVIANGRDDTGKDYIICNGLKKKCICLKKEHGPFVIPDLDAFPVADPIGGPLSRFVLVNTQALANECALLSRPIVRSG